MSTATPPTLDPSITSTQAHPTPRAAALFIAAIAVAGLSVSLIQTLVIPAMPALPAQLDVNAAAISWLITATLLSAAVSTPIVASLADRFGKRRLILITLSLALLGSLVAPLHGFESLIIGRTLQGLGTGLIPVGMSAMRDQLPPQRVGGAVALISATLGVGGGLGVPLGGALMNAFGWASLFVVSAALSAVALAFVVFAMRPTPIRSTGGFDYAGAVLLSLGLVALLLAVSQGASWGWGSASTLGSLGAGIVFLAAWAVLELRLKNPMIDVRANFTAPLLFSQLAAVVLGLALFVNLIMTTVQLQGPREQHGFGWDASTAGLAMIPQALSMLAVAPVASGLITKVGARATLGVGAALVFVAYAARIVLTPNPALLIVWTTVVAIGVSIAYAALPMTVMAHVPPEETAQANGVNSVLRSVGGAIGSTVVAAITSALSVGVAGGGRVASSAGITTVYVVAAVAGLLALLFTWLAKERTATA